MMTIWLSWEQIQKIRDKSIKESIVAEMQNRYSRNLWSSSFGGQMYESLEATFKKGSNNINFLYNSKDDDKESIKNTFINNFNVEYINEYNFNDSAATPISSKDEITLLYHPYKMECDIGWLWDKSLNNLAVVVRVNDIRYYCFEIQRQNCRLLEVSYEGKCEPLLKNLWLIEK